MQGTSWDFRSLHGYWSYVRQDGGDHGEGCVPVRIIKFVTLCCCSTIPSRPSAYPQSGIFAFCDPNIPCIIPGTYAFLGAAAALRFVNTD